MKSTSRTYVLVLSAIALIHYSCSDDVVGPVDAPGNQSNERISITNDESALDPRVRYFDQEVPIGSGGFGLMAKRTRLQAFSLTLVAEVIPPTVSGQVVQATSTAMKLDDRAIVSYNMRGGQYLGGIDVFKFPPSGVPKLKSEALFNDSDISSVSYDADKVYLAEATGDAMFPYPAVFEVMNMTKDKLVLDGNQRFPLTSFAGTSVALSSNNIYVTSGDNGRLSVFDRTTLALKDSFDLIDARWVDVDGGKVVVVQGGTPGQISVFDEASLSVLNTFTFTGADIPESKSTVQVVGGKAFIAAGTGGVQVLSVNTGTVVGSVPRPDPASLGLDPSKVVTNAVSVAGDLMFISNGEAGVYVAQAAVPFDQSGSEDPLNLTVLGQLQFDNLQSVNHVAYNGTFLVIAAGLGGLKMVRVDLM